MPKNNSDEHSISMAVRRVMQRKTRIESQKELAECVLRELRKEDPDVRVSAARIRRIAVTSGAAKLEIDYRETDKKALPEGLAASVKNAQGKQPTIDRTSELYAQSKELENYMMKMMLSSMRDTIHHTSLFGKENDFARGMYEDMMYDNYAEALTKNTHFGLADQIYLELSGNR